MFTVLGKSNCETDVIGASISPGGNIFVTPVGFKRMQQKQDLKPSPNPSGGASYSYGTSSQTEGMSDINGDGLCDYYNGGSYKLNIGDEASIIYSGQTYTYKLVNVYEINKTGKAKIIRDSRKSTMTLITCKHNTDKQVVYIFERSE